MLEYLLSKSKEKDASREEGDAVTLGSRVHLRFVKLSGQTNPILREPMPVCMLCSTASDGCRRVLRRMRTTSLKLDDTRQFYTSKYPTLGDSGDTQ